MRQTADLGYIITGCIGDGDLWLIKTDSSGDTLSTRTYRGTGFEKGTFVQQTPDGGYFVTGQTDSYGAREDVYFLKTDENGNVGVGESKRREVVREERKELTVSPNPFTQKVVIRYLSSVTNNQ